MCVLVFVHTCKVHWHLYASFSFVILFFCFFFLFFHHKLPFAANLELCEHTFCSPNGQNSCRIFPLTSFFAACYEHVLTINLSSVTNKWINKADHRSFKFIRFVGHFASRFHDVLQYNTNQRDIVNRSNKWILGLKFVRLTIIIFLESWHHYLDQQFLPHKNTSWKIVHKTKTFLSPYFNFRSLSTWN